MQRKVAAVARHDRRSHAARAEHEHRFACIATAEERLPGLIASPTRDAGELAHGLLGERREPWAGGE
jgi:hypothetical protein